MTTLHRLLPVAALLLSTLAPAAARAQDIAPPALDPTLMVGWAGGEAVRYDLETRAGISHGSYAHDTEVIEGRRAAHLTYTPTAALRQQTVAGLVNKLKAGSPAGANAVQAAFGPGKSDYDQLYREAIKSTAFADNDAAAALAAYLELGYQVVNNLTASNAIAPAQERGLRAQAAGILAQNSAMEDAAAVARLGEGMKLQTVVLLLGWQESRKSGQDAAFRANIARQFQQSYHLDMSQLRLTDQGFAKK